MTIQRGITKQFEQDLLQQYFQGATIKLALYGPDATLNRDTAAYTSDNEIQTWSEYPAGGVTLTSRHVTTVEETVHMDFDDVSFSDFPLTVTVRGGLIYNDNATNDSLVVIDFGQNYSSTDGIVNIDLSHDTLQRYIINMQVGHI